MSWILASMWNYKPMSNSSLTILFWQGRQQRVQDMGTVYNGVTVSTPKRVRSIVIPVTHMCKSCTSKHYRPEPSAAPAGAEFHLQARTWEANTWKQGFEKVQQDASHQFSLVPGEHERELRMLGCWKEYL